MAAYNKFQDYVEQLNKAVHDWSTHTFKAALSNTAPAATDTVLATGGAHPPPAATNGYAAGGQALDGVTLSEAAGTAKLVITDEVFTAAGGNLGPFRYVIIYNDTAAGDPLVCYFDYGSSITLADTETFTIDFSGANGLWQLV